LSCELISYNRQEGIGILAIEEFHESFRIAISKNLRAIICDRDNELWLSPISVWETVILSCQVFNLLIVIGVRG
jgi:PIN domain nuclease of toxin-antitoxin system